MGFFCFLNYFLLWFGFSLGGVCVWFVLGFLLGFFWVIFVGFVGFFGGGESWFEGG